MLTPTQANFGVGLLHLLVGLVAATAGGLMYTGSLEVTAVPTPGAAPTCPELHPPSTSSLFRLTGRIIFAVYSCGGLLISEGMVLILFTAFGCLSRVPSGAEKTFVAVLTFGMVMLEFSTSLLVVYLTGRLTPFYGHLPFMGSYLEIFGPTLAILLLAVIVCQLCWSVNFFLLEDRESGRIGQEDVDIVPWQQKIKKEVEIERKV